MTALVALSTVVLLSGCVAAEAAPAPAPASTPSASPSPEPTTPAVLPKPVAAFGGDCAAVFGDAGGATLTVGATALPIEPAALTGPARTISVIGGFRCSGRDVGSGDSIGATVVPAAAIADRAPAQPITCSESDSGSGMQRECWATVVVGGYAMSARANAGPGSSFDLEAAIDTLSVRLSAAAEREAPVAIASPAGMWAHRTDCEPIADAAAAVLGDAVTGRADRTTSAGPGMDVDFAAYDAGGWGTCILSSETGDPTKDLAVLYLPGAGWALEESLSDGSATPTEVDGAVLAGIVNAESGDQAGRGIAVTDGVNLLFVTTRDLNALAPTEAVAAAILAAS
ncbi:hypothetical protein GCM10009717_08940 [Agromyces allii]|uniref:Uncharacterized protein n=1 Tax=Agromyces allii TaxID=393607 RepID=A0ABN2Q567_9MICO